MAGLSASCRLIAFTYLGHSPDVAEETGAYQPHGRRNFAVIALDARNSILYLIAIGGSQL